MCGGSTTKDSTPPSDTGVRRNSPNRDSSSKNLSNTPLPVHCPRSRIPPRAVRVRAGRCAAVCVACAGRPRAIRRPCARTRPRPGNGSQFPGRRNGRIIAGRVLDHGRPRNAQFPSYLRMRQAFRLELPDTLLNTHRCRHSFPPEDHVLVVSTRESIRNRTAPALLFRRCRFQPPTVSDMNAHTVQIWW